MNAPTHSRSLKSVAITLALLITVGAVMLFIGGRPQRITNQALTNAFAPQEIGVRTQPGTESKSQPDIQQLKKSALDIYRRSPIKFEPNVGQFDDDVKFATRASGYGLFISNTDAVVTLRKQLAVKNKADAQDSVTHSTTQVKLRFKGANREAEVHGEEELPSKSFYFIGNDSSKWHSNVPHYAKVRQKEIYKGIDAIYYGINGSIEYDLEIRPGASVSQVRIACEGARNISTDEDGNLLITTANGTLRQSRPTIYQTINGEKIPVNGRYTIGPNKIIGFEVPEYDRSTSLVIDPTLYLSSYLGGSGDDEALAIAVDSTGTNAYVAGRTTSTDLPRLPVFNAPGHSGGGDDAFVSLVALTNSFSRLIYSVYFGGNGNDQAKGIAIAPTGFGFVEITGETNSTNFPTTQAQQGTIGGSSDAFVTRFSADSVSGINIGFSTYLGGTGPDSGNAIAIDPSGNAYVTGNTGSADFPKTIGVRQPVNNGSQDFFITKINSAGQRQYSTYLGGTNSDNATGIAVDASGNAYVTGVTLSTDFPLQAPIQDSLAGGSDSVIAKINPTGTELLYSTFLGGTSADETNSIAVDSTGNAFVTGRTFSPNFPHPNGLQPSLSGFNDAFLTKVNAAGSSFLFSTYFGGSGLETGFGVGVDSAGNPYIAGRTTSTDLPVTGATQGNSGGGTDAFVAQFNADGTARLFSTYLGGSGEDRGLAIAVSPSGRIIVTGQTSSADFSRVRELQFGPSGLPEAFVAAFFPPTRLTIRSANPGSGVAIQVTPNDIDGNGNGVTEFFRTFNAGTFVELTAPPQSSNGNVFVKWQMNGADFGTNPVISIEALSDHTLTAVYVTPPPNDNFVNAQTISGVSGSVTGTNVGSSKEPDETTVGHSVWYKWQAPANGDFTFSTFGSDFNTLLFVFTGESVGALTGRGTSDDDAQSFCSTFISRVTFTATQGQTYYLAVDGANSFTFPAITGNIRLKWGKSAKISGEVVGSGGRIEMTGGICLLGEGTPSGYTINNVPTGFDYNVEVSSSGSSGASFGSWGTSRTLLTPLTGDVSGINFVQRTPVFSISGRVETAAGNALSATITCPNVRPELGGFPVGGQVNGDFNLGGFSVANSYACSASNPGFTFSPSSLTVSSNGSFIRFTGTPAPISIRVETNPAGRTISIDGGTPVTAPQDVQWVPGSSHTIATTATQAGTTGTQFVFDNWSDGGALSHTVTAPATATTFTANFTTQFQLTMSAGSGGNVSPPSGFFNSGQSVQISATPNSGFNFAGWTGTGTGSFTGSTNPVNVTMNGPITQTASFSAIAPQNTIQFSSAAASASEAANQLTVTVNRNVTTAAASVDYATNDTAGADQCNQANGKASSRCDYLITLGTLQFAAGEASKTLNIPIVNDVYAEGDETFTITLANPTGATLGATGTSTLTITDNESTNGTNPIETSSFFVRQHYIDFLNREPDQSGFNFWVNEIENCGANAECRAAKRIHVSAAFFLSIEFQETGYLVYRFYKSGLGNLPGAPVPVSFLDFLKGTQQIGLGVQVNVGDWQAKLEANKQAYALAFVQRADFQSAFPNSMTADQFVTKLDTNAGSVLSPSEKADLIAMLGATPGDAAKRSLVLRAVAEDDTLEQAEFNKAFVLMQYFGYLRRNPNDAPDSNFDGLNFWLNKLNEFNGNFINAEMVKAFITSIEYRQRFGP